MCQLRLIAHFSRLDQIIEADGQRHDLGNPHADWSATGIVSADYLDGPTDARSVGIDTHGDRLSVRSPPATRLHFEQLSWWLNTGSGAAWISTGPSHHASKGMHANEWAKGLDQLWGDRPPGSRAILMLEQSLLPYITRLGGGRFETGRDANDDFLRVVNSYLRGKCDAWSTDLSIRIGRRGFCFKLLFSFMSHPTWRDDPNGQPTMSTYYIQLTNMVRTSD